VAKKKETSSDRKQRAMDAVIRAFDDAVDPKNLTRKEYIEFMGELISDLQMSLETAVQAVKREKKRLSMKQVGTRRSSVRNPRSLSPGKKPKSDAVYTKLTEVGLRCEQGDDGGDYFCPEDASYQLVALKGAVDLALCAWHAALGFAANIADQSSPKAGDAIRKAGMKLPNGVESEDR
jgi:hypothetical protein